MKQPLFAARPIQHLALASLLCLPLFSPTSILSAATKGNALSFTSDDAAGLLEVRSGDQKLLVYAYAPAQFKPYVKELYTLRGENVLLDAPADHLHHHGLMYAISVNGVNFWEESNQPGYQRSVGKPLASVAIGKDGIPQVVIAHQLHWVAQKDARAASSRPAALLTERRALVVSLDATNEEVSVIWRSDFAVGSGTDKAILSGADYHGLGLRFPHSWDKGAQHSNSANAPYPTAGQRDVLAAKWSAVANPAAGDGQMVALFAGVSNPGPSKFFSMLEPFTYLSATQGLDQEKLEYVSGRKFVLEYLITTYPAIKSASFLHQRFQQWQRK